MNFFKHFHFSVFDIMSMQITIQYMPDDGQCCTETVAFYNTLGCPLSKADRGPTKTLSSFIQDLQRSSLVNPLASPRAGTKPWLRFLSFSSSMAMSMSSATSVSRTLFSFYSIYDLLCHHLCQRYVLRVFICNCLFLKIDQTLDNH